MVRKVAVGIAYCIAIIFVLSILWPSVYCFTNGCRGPGELDAFMPAFLLIPIGAVATAFSLHNSIQNIRKSQSPWLFWPLAIIFGMMLLAVAAVIVTIIYQTAIHRPIPFHH
jgi:hypothetical protein